MQVDSQRVQGDLPSDGVPGGWAIAVLVQAHGTPGPDGLVVEQVELESYAFGDFKSGVRGIVGIGPVSQTSAHASQCTWTFSLDAKRQTVRRVVSRGGLETKDRVERPDIHGIRDKNTSRLQVVFAGQPEDATGGARAAV